MAAATTKMENSGIFWMNGVSDDEQPLAIVPGVDGDLVTGSNSLSSKRGVKIPTRRGTDLKNEATLKKTSKTQGHLQTRRSGSYTKKKVSVHHVTTAATEHAITPALNTFLHPSQVITEANRAKSQVCLKDLCAEDKRRIANLIEELARVSEEKEESMQRLKDEQEKFECKIQKLEQQNLIIAQERESLQQQYKECQELLGLYQQYLSQQQAKLNQSIAQLSQEPAHSPKLLSSEEVPSRTSIRRIDGSLFDGSYLGLPATRAQQPQVTKSADGGWGAVQTCSEPVSLSSVSELSSTHGQTKQHRIHKRECREPHSESCHRSERCQGSGQNGIYGTQQWKRGNSSHLESGHHDTFTKCECERQQSGNAMGLTNEQTLTRPLLGHEDWEEKRHQLLLQKMQLELERERLQARLIEQEQRLNKQNQQLHQTHLDYSRFQQATQAELSNSNTRTGDPQPEGPSHRDLPSSVHEDARLHPTEHSLHEKCLQSVPVSQDSGIQTHEALEQSRRDMATSPVKSPTSFSKPTSLSTIHKTPDARLDFSLVELLDVLSPVSAPVQSKLTTQSTRMTQRRPALTTPKSVGRTLLTFPGSCPQRTQQDLEESQILEDIFFIC